MAASSRQIRGLTDDGDEEPLSLLRAPISLQSTHTTTAHASSPIAHSHNHHRADDISSMTSASSPTLYGREPYTQPTYAAPSNMLPPAPELDSAENTPRTNPSKPSIAQPQELPLSDSLYSSPSSSPRHASNTDDDDDDMNMTSYMHYLQESSPANSSCSTPQSTNTTSSSMHRQRTMPCMPSLDREASTSGPPTTISTTSVQPPPSLLFATSEGTGGERTAKTNNRSTRQLDDAEMQQQTDSQKQLLDALPVATQVDAQHPGAFSVPTTHDFISARQQEEMAKILAESKDNNSNNSNSNNSNSNTASSTNSLDIARGVPSRPPSRSFRHPWQTEYAAVTPSDDSEMATTNNSLHGRRSFSSRASSSLYPSLDMLRYITGTLEDADDNPQQEEESLPEDGLEATSDDMPQQQPATRLPKTEPLMHATVVRRIVTPNFHDSLQSSFTNEPSVGSDEPTKSQRWYRRMDRCCKWWIGIMVVVLFIFLGLGVWWWAVAQRGQSKSQEKSAAAQAPVASPTAAPTMSPRSATTAPTMAQRSATTEPTMSQRSATTEPTAAQDTVFTERFIQLYSLLSPSLTPDDGALIQQPSSPQHKAMAWLSSDDDVVYDFTNAPISQTLQRYASAVLYHSTNGDRWDKSIQFLSSSKSICEWNNLDFYEGDMDRSLGIICDPTDDEVIHIQLAGNDLNGTIPTELAFFTSLEKLDFDDNNLHSTIPTQIFTMPNLQYFWFLKNSIAGAIPTEVGNATSLWSIDWNQNKLTGTIPTELGLLTNLRYLGINEQANLHGTLPSQLGRLRELVDLDLHGNRLRGAIPQAAGRWTQLQHLYLHSNALQGELPTQMQHLTSMEVFSIYSNVDITGALPEQLREWRTRGALQSAYLDDTSLTGSLDDILCVGDWESLYADCINEVECTCCTHCCDDENGCKVN